MKTEDYPALFRSSDEASNASQSTYLWLIRFQYTLLAAAAAISLFVEGNSGLVLLFAFVVGASTALLIFMAVKKPERDWYSCRALAESIKTSTWRYMMKAEPFETAESIHECRGKFASFLKEILDANSHVRDSISRRPNAGAQISGKMDEIRALPLGERVDLYLNQRIQEQRNWYIEKVKYNRRSFVCWVVFCVCVQGGAIALALLRSNQPGLLPIWPSEPLLVVASAALGWIQIKKFNEQASAYSLTAHEIGIIQSRLVAITDDDEFSDFVNEAERAFSREHTQWVARQDD